MFNDDKKNDNMEVTVEETETTIIKDNKTIEEDIVTETVVEKTPVEEVKENKPSTISKKISDKTAPEVFNPFEIVRNPKFAKPKFAKPEADQEFEERVINIKRVIKVTKGGRKFKFSVLVVVGDKKGRVGFGVAKSIEIPDAIKKAARLARKNLYQINIVGDQATIPHEIIGKHGSANVLLKPAKEGKGIITSDIIRSVVELAGIRNIYSKNLGTKNPQNVIIATINGLTQTRTREEIFSLRGKKK